MGCGSSTPEPLSDPYPQQRSRGHYSSTNGYQGNHHGNSYEGGQPEQADGGLVFGGEVDQPVVRTARERPKKPKVEEEEEFGDNTHTGYDLTVREDKNKGSYMFRTTTRLDTRRNPDDVKWERPRVDPPQLWEDEDFSKGGVEGLGSDVTWKRPQVGCT